jgi:3-vinyl bacteriochlorophyllide hydratase
MYTEEQRRIRDRSVWTKVQAFLAPLQFIVFLVSLGLVLRYLGTSEGYAVATASIIAKTMVLYLIMVTGAIWEREVFGQYLFAEPFFWEDAVSILVLALHTAYLAGLAMGWSPEALILTALLAYASYVLNAGQFVFALLRAKRTVAPASAEMAS